MKNTNILQKIIIEDKIFNLTGENSYFYVKPKDGYVLNSIRGNTFVGIYIVGFSYDNGQYDVFLNAAPSSNATYSAKLTWLKV